MVVEAAEEAAEVLAAPPKLLREAWEPLLELQLWATVLTTPSTPSKVVIVPLFSTGSSV